MERMYYIEGWTRGVVNTRWWGKTNSYIKEGEPSRQGGRQLNK